MTPIIAYELRWRVQSSGQPWTTARYAPDATTIVLTGLTRGVAYEAEARSLGANGTASEWAPVTWTIATTNREGTAALPPVTAGNVSSRWVSGTEITWSADDTSATVEVSAGVLQVGEKQISYSASSVDVPGTASEEKTLYLYYDDPTFAGGARTLGYTTDSVTSMAAYGRVLIDQVTITYDSAGGSGTSGGGDIGGGGGGSGGTCPDETAWTTRRRDDGTIEPVRMGDVAIGDWLRLVDGRFGRVSRRRRIKAARVRVHFGEGHALTCSRTAKLVRDRGGYLLAPATVGAKLASSHFGERSGDIVSSVESLEPGWVIDITVENSAYLVGDDPDHQLGHHNIKNDPLG